MHKFLDSFFSKELNKGELVSLSSGMFLGVGFLMLYVLVFFALLGNPELFLTCPSATIEDGYQEMFACLQVMGFLIVLLAGATLTNKITECFGFWSGSFLCTIGLFYTL